MPNMWTTIISGLLLIVQCSAAHSSGRTKTDNGWIKSFYQSRAVVSEGHDAAADSSFTRSIKERASLLGIPVTETGFAHLDTVGSYDLLPNMIRTLAARPADFLDAGTCGTVHNVLDVYPDNTFDYLMSHSLDGFEVDASALSDCPVVILLANAIPVAADADGLSEVGLEAEKSIEMSIKNSTVHLPPDLNKLLIRVLQTIKVNTRIKQLVVCAASVFANVSRANQESSFREIANALWYAEQDADVLAHEMASLRRFDATTRLELVAAMAATQELFYAKTLLSASIEIRPSLRLSFQTLWHFVYGLTILSRPIPEDGADKGVAIAMEAIGHACSRNVLRAASYVSYFVSKYTRAAGLRPDIWRVWEVIRWNAGATYANVHVDEAYFLLSSRHKTARTIELEKAAIREIVKIDQFVSIPMEEDVNTFLQWYNILVNAASCGINVSAPVYTSIEAPIGMQRQALAGPSQIHKRPLRKTVSVDELSQNKDLHRTPHSTSELDVLRAESDPYLVAVDDSNTELSDYTFLSKDDKLGRVPYMHCQLVHQRWSMANTFAARTQSPAASLIFVAASEVKRKYWRPVKNESTHIDVLESHTALMPASLLFGLLRPNTSDLDGAQMLMLSYAIAGGKANLSFEDALQIVLIFLVGPSRVHNQLKDLRERLQAAGQSIDLVDVINIDTAISRFVVLNQSNDMMLLMLVLLLKPLNTDTQEESGVDVRDVTLDSLYGVLVEFGLGFVEAGAALRTLKWHGIESEHIPLTLDLVIRASHRALVGHLAVKEAMERSSSPWENQWRRDDMTQLVMFRAHLGTLTDEICTDQRQLLRNQVLANAATIGLDARFADAVCSRFDESSVLGRMDVFQALELAYRSSLHL